MRIPHPSSGETKFHALESAISSAQSLEDLRFIEDELLLWMTEKTEGVVFPILTKLYEKKEIFLQREQAEFEKEPSLETLYRLHTLFSYEALENSFIEGKEEILCLLNCPLLEELEKDSIHSNFYSRVQRIRDALLNTEELSYLECLSFEQKRRIFYES